ncbi:MAG TPA: hypothetical protein VMQ63_00965 [Stellaceae bacterium]|nr:hypothetical protein [Stellaceae bacterium]
MQPILEAQRLIENVDQGQIADDIAHRQRIEIGARGKAPATPSLVPIPVELLEGGLPDLDDLVEHGSIIAQGA